HKGISKRQKPGQAERFGTPSRQCAHSSRSSHVGKHRECSEPARARSAGKRGTDPPIPGCSCESMSVGQQPFDFLDPVETQTERGWINLSLSLISSFLNLLIEQEAAVRRDVVSCAYGGAASKRRLFEQHDWFFRNEL